MTSSESAVRYTETPMPAAARWKAQRQRRGPSPIAASAPMAA